jgi:hypothetical protein
VKLHDSNLDQDRDDDEGIVKNFIAIEEGTFHISGQVNRHDLRIMGTNDPYESLDHEGTISKLMFPSLRTALHGSEGPVKKLIAKSSVACGRHLNIDFILFEPLMAPTLSFINENH